MPTQFAVTPEQFAVEPPDPPHKSEAGEVARWQHQVQEIPFSAVGGEELIDQGRVLLSTRKGAEHGNRVRR